MVIIIWYRGWTLGIAMLSGGGPGRIYLCSIVVKLCVGGLFLNYMQFYCRLVPKRRTIKEISRKISKNL